MDFLNQYLPGFSQIWNIAWLIFFRYYGWVLFVIAAIYILWRMYYVEIRHQAVHDQEWVFLNIKVPADNQVSTLAVESIFAQLHALHSSLTFAEKYIEGRDQLWFSLEIISLGGKISFVIRSPKNYQDLAEAAIYSHYPKAEISEIDDYMENLEYDPKTSEFDVWGVEFAPVEDQVIPIKTYRDFEHPSAVEKIIDPLNNLYEALVKMEPHEFFGIQILIQPLADPEWKPKGEIKVKQLIGEEVPHDPKISGLVLSPLEKFAAFSFKHAVAGSHGHDAVQKNQKNDWMSLTEAQKERVTLIERKIGKPGYKTKIRQIYLCPKDKFVKKKPYVIIGAYRLLGSAMTNQLKPSGKIWTSIPYKFSPTLEAGYINWVNNKRKKRVLKAFKDRDIHLGLPPFIMNTEELATLYHFPIATEAQAVSSSIEKTESKKAQPPANLPVGDLEG